MIVVFIILFLLLLLLFGPLGPNAATWIAYFIFTFCYLWQRKNGKKMLFWLYFSFAQLTLIAWAIYECSTY